MKTATFMIIIVGLTYVNSGKAFSQPLRLDATGNGWYSLNLLKVDRGVSGYAYSGGGNGLGIKASYVIQQWNISPLLRLQYYFPVYGIPKVSEVNARVLKPSGYLVDVGIEKSFKLDYSTFSLYLSVGYNWENNVVEGQFGQKVSFTQNEPVYIAGTSLHLPFLSGVDVVLGYTILFREKRTFEQEAFNATYTLETVNLYHILSVGVSFQFFEQLVNN